MVNLIEKPMEKMKEKTLPGAEAPTFTLYWLISDKNSNLVIIEDLKMMLNLL